MPDSIRTPIAGMPQQQQAFFQPMQQVGSTGNLSSYLGAVLSITLMSNEKEVAHIGRLYTIDTITGTLVLLTQHPPVNGQKLHNVVMINISNISSFTVIPANDPLAAAHEHTYLPEPRRVRPQALYGAIEATRAAAAHIGTDTTPLGQSIFNALARLMDCRWSKQSIIIMDEVELLPPYTGENLRPLPNLAESKVESSLHRIRKVVEGERMKSLDSTGSSTKTGGI